MIVSELIKEKRLMSLLLDCVNHLRNEVKAQNIPEKDWPVPFASQYMTKLQERVLLIKTLIRINPKISEIVNFEFLNTIWN